MKKDIPKEVNDLFDLSNGRRSQNVYKVGYWNDQGDWITKSRHNNQVNAEIMADVVEKSGYRTRMTHQGKIVKEG